MKGYFWWHDREKRILKEIMDLEKETGSRLNTQEMALIILGQSLPDLKKEDVYGNKIL